MAGATLPVALRIPRTDRAASVRWFARRNPRTTGQRNAPIRTMHTGKKIPFTRICNHPNISRAAGYGSIRAARLYAMLNHAATRFGSRQTE